MKRPDICDVVKGDIIKKAEIKHDGKVYTLEYARDELHVCLRRNPSNVFTVYVKVDGVSCETDEDCGGRRKIFAIHQSSKTGKQWVSLYNSYERSDVEQSDSIIFSCDIPWKKVTT